MVLMTVRVTEQAGQHEYIARRAVGVSSCARYRSDWLRISEGEKYACLSGPYNDQEENSGGKTSSYWVFDKVKTRKGCVSYFEGECSLRYLLKRGCVSK
jgi:hypothetical protein